MTHRRDGLPLLTIPTLPAAAHVAGSSIRRRAGLREEVMGKDQSKKPQRHSSSSMTTGTGGGGSGMVATATHNSGGATTRRLSTSRSHSELWRLSVNPNSEVLGQLEGEAKKTELRGSPIDEYENSGMLVLNKSEMDALEIPPHFSFEVEAITDASTVNGGAIFSFSNQKKDVFGEHVGPPVSGSSQRHRKKHRRKLKYPSSVSSADVGKGRQMSAPRHVDEFRGQQLEPLFVAAEQKDLCNHHESLVPELGVIKNVNECEIANEIDGKKGKRKKDTLPPIVIKQPDRGQLTRFIPGMHPDVPFSYTPGGRDPLSGNRDRTPPLSLIHTPLLATPSLLTPIYTHSVRLDSGLEESGNQMIRQYFPDMMLKIFIGTWNMHEQKEVLDSLDDFLLPATVEMLQDIYVIGVQECYMDRHDWDVKLQETLGSSHVLAYSCRQGCLQLSVFIRRDLIWFCCGFADSNIITTFKPASMIKTKGGLAIAFSIFGTSLLFINSHLSAHEEKMLVRHTEVSKICQSLAIPKGGSYGVNDVTYRYDCVFWFGDLNYRCDADRAEMDRLLSRGDIHGALMKDQLAKEMENGDVFSGFSEQPILFPPTYKFNPNSDEYDTSEKHRTQSWTDRILFKSRYGTSITGHHYDCCDSVHSSDHRPVCAVFHAMLQVTEDNSLPNAPVQFNHSVYSEGNARRRTRQKKPSSSSASHSSCEDGKSGICVIL